VHYVVSCNLAIWLRCEENSANMVSTVFRGGCDVHRGMKNCDFRPLSCVISEMIPDMAIDTMEDELQESIELCNFQRPRLSLKVTTFFNVK